MNIGRIEKIVHVVLEPLPATCKGVECVEPACVRQGCVEVHSRIQAQEVVGVAG